MPRATTGRELTDDQRSAVYHRLLQLKRNGRVGHGEMKNLMQSFNISQQTISRIWRRGCETAASLGVAKVGSQKKGRCGRPRKYKDEDVRSAVTSAPAHLRGNYRTMAKATGVPKTALWRLVKAKKLNRRTSRLRPMLTPQHRVARYNFAKSFIRDGYQGRRQWHDMLDCVHIDEKWFYITQVNRRFYLWHDEPTPQRKAQSKRHITKVMFLCAVARPRHDSAHRKMWDGKVGLWPFVETQLAKRRSKNRDRGTPVTVPMTVTKPVYRRFLVDKVIPAIQAQWPGRRGATIYVQQDNAKPHVAVDDPEVLAAGRKEGWNIQLMAQPAQSPDFNVLDLGFFNAIQSLQHQTTARTIDDLIKCVEDAFENLAWRVLDKTFMTLQKVMEEAMRSSGDNVYKLPHLKKDMQFKTRVTELRPSCDEDVLLAIESMESRLEDEQRVGEIVGLLDSGVSGPGANDGIEVV
ncbi:hypothetical protein AaE_007495 [Aphanomyces astaci]|uniref:DUF7769 domain-containing protein n=1 Tax=Aphanomyces astaci TaxID=112090 RepID=A0A6A5AA16_APHAT|nr:hypothetical protein AaE_007495 [Aphanomyces astaci]